MRRIALALFGFSLAAASPAAADLEDCVAPLEAVEIYGETVAPAHAAFRQAQRQADEVHAAASF